MSNFKSNKVKKIGRPKSLSEQKSVELVLDYYTFPVSFRVLAKRYKISPMTVRRVVQDKVFVESVLSW